MDDSEALVLFVVYDHPSDYPDKWIVRRQRVSNGGIEVEQCLWAEADTLEKAREAIPQWLYRLPRQEGDEAVIWETWL